MKTLLFILCLFFSTLVNGQIVNYKDFYNEKMDSVMFDTLKQYGDYTYDVYLFDRNKIHDFIKRNRNKLSVDEMVEKINTDILKNPKNIPSIVGIMTSVQCKSLKTYQEIASKCNSNWNNPSDAFFRSQWGNKIMTVSYYDKKADICYVFACYE